MDRNHSAFYIFHKKKRKLFNNFLQYIVKNTIYCIYIVMRKIKNL